MKKQIGLLTLSLMLVTPAALAGGAGAPVKAPAKGCVSIGQIIKTNSQLSTLNTAVEAAGLQSVLSGQGSFTVFAPSNAAFAKLPSDKLAGLLNDREALRNLLAYHVVGEKATAAQLRGVKGGTTVQGADITIMVHGKGLMVNNAMVTKADLLACNGVVHIIDTVLMPPAMAQAPQPKPTPAPTAPKPTTPAPANPVITAPAIVIPALPQGGTTVTAPAPAPAPVTAPATTTDTAATTTTTATTETTATTDTATTDTTTTDTTTTDTVATTNTLYDVISNDDNYSTFRDLLSDSGMTEELSSDTGEYTVVVPTNAAFEAMPEGQLAAISSDQTALRNFLSAYIIKSKVTSDQISGGNVDTLAGGHLTLNNAKLGELVTADNGNLYPVDTVLMPDGFQIPTVAVVAADTSALAPNVITYLISDPRFSTFRGLLTTAELADTLTSGDYTIFAPTDDAFAKVDAEQLNTLRKDKEKLTAFLKSLMVAGKPDAATLLASPVTTLGGGTVTITQDGSNLKVGNAVTAGDATATGNGNVYALSSVQLPDSK